MKTKDKKEEKSNLTHRQKKFVLFLEEYLPWVYSHVKGMASGSAIFAQVLTDVLDIMGVKYKIHAVLYEKVDNVEVSSHLHMFTNFNSGIDYNSILVEIPGGYFDAEGSLCSDKRTLKIKSINQISKKLLLRQSDAESYNKRFMSLIQSLVWELPRRFKTWKEGSFNQSLEQLVEKAETKRQRRKEIAVMPIA